MTEKDKPVRKRNVVSRGRTGCLTCRRRRLKCDEGKPACYSCTRLNLKCEGYAQRISFKDQTSLVIERARGKSAQKRKPSETIKDEDDSSSPPQPTDAGGTIDKGASPPSPKLISPPATIPRRSLSPQSPYARYTQTDNKQLGLGHIFQDRFTSFNSLSSPGAVDSPRSVAPFSDTTIENNLAGNTFYSDNQWEGQEDEQSDSRYYAGMAPASSDSDYIFTTDTPVMEMAVSRTYMTPNSPIRIPSSSPSRPLPNAFLSLCGAYEFPEDILYYEYSAGNNFQSLSRVLPLSELFRSEPVSPHVYNAALALAALNLASLGHYPKNPVTLRRHAFQHSLKAVQGIREDLSSVEKLKALSKTTNMDTSLSLLATIILLANFELQRGSLFSWRSHMRGAASCLSIWHKEMAQRPAGMLLVKAFARMALLLRMYNEDYSVTTPDIMPPRLALWLNRLLAESSQKQDQLLLLVEEVTQLEINYRQQPELGQKWIAQNTRVLSKLAEWRKDIPPSELPVPSSGGAGVTISITPQTSTDSQGLTHVPALYFPNSADPCTAAVNYAAYLMTGMRARTRYLPRRIVPPDAEDTALTICRIAAGISPVSFGQSYTYGYGMLPSVVGACRWTSNPGLKAWVMDFLAGYKGSREGIWNVTHSRRLLEQLEREFARRHPDSGWEFIAARVVDEPQDPSPELEEADSGKSFKVVMRGRTKQGYSEDLVEVS